VVSRARHADTYIVKAVETATSHAKKCSYFYWVEYFLGPRGFAFVDSWALSFLALSIAAFCIALFTTNETIQWLIVVGSAVRVFEYLNYLFWVILFARPNKGKTDLRSYKRSVLLLMFNYAETIFWFSTWYALLAAKDFVAAVQGPLWIALLRESVMSMVANWSGNVTLSSGVALAVVTFQGFVGLFMTVVVGARIIALLPRPSSADPDERK
jgi:hypothetical protein